MKITDKHILEAKQLLEQRKAEYWIQQGVVNTLEKIFLSDSVTDAAVNAERIEESKNATEPIIPDGDHDSPEPGSDDSSSDTV